MKFKLMGILKEINQCIKLKFSVKGIILTLLSALLFLGLYSLFSHMRGIFLYVFSILVGIFNIIILVSVTIIYLFKRKLKIFKIPLVIFLICICSLVSGFIASSIYINEVNREGTEIIEALNKYYSRNEKYPEYLAELYPEFLSFTSKSLKDFDYYSKDGQSYSITKYDGSCGSVYFSEAKGWLPRPCP